jgi:hypothetical protein
MPPGARADHSKPLAYASVLVRKASVAFLYGLNSLKTRSAAQHKLQLIVVDSLAPPELDQDRSWRTSHTALKLLRVRASTISTIYNVHQGATI